MCLYLEYYYKFVEEQGQSQVVLYWSNSPNKKRREGYGECI